MRVGLAISVLLALAACKRAPEGDASRISDFCDQWVAALCAKNASCCDDSMGKYASVGACITAQRASCPSGIAFVGVGTNAPIAFFDNPGAASAALVALTSAPCANPRPTLDAINHDPTMLFIRGTRTAGQDCSPIGSDLSPTVSCLTGYRCELGATAAGTITGQCVIESGPGTACATQTCGVGYFCKLDPGATAGVCTPQTGPASMSRACAHDYECLDTTCASDPGAPTSVCGAPSTGAAQWCFPGAGNLPRPDASMGADAGI